MDTVLTSVTLISLGLAGALGVLLAKLRRDERRRSDARVAALDALAAEPAARAVSWNVRHAPADGVRIRREPEARRRARGPEVPDRERAIDNLEIRPSAPAAVAVADIFAEPARSSPWGRRFAVIGLLAVFGGAVLSTVALRRGGPDVTAAKATAAPGVSTAAIAPLELVSLRHTQDGDTLTITGLVQNPKTGAPLVRLTATAVAFAPDGTFLAGGKAPLDYTSLGAGDESPFVVTVSVRGSVARYRVGFRGEDGSVVAHVDRRAGDVARRAP